MRITFVHDWQPDLEQELTQRDGIFAALSELRKRGHDIDFITFSNVEHSYRVPHPLVGWIRFCNQEKTDLYDRLVEFKPDVILMWADMTRPNAQICKNFGVPMAICFAGGNTMGPNWPLFDHIFVESTSYLNHFKNTGVSASVAFGTNSSFFVPLPRQKKTFDVIFPATYCDWKRHHLLAEALRDENFRVVTAGYMYSNQEVEDYQVCQDAGFTVLPHVSASVLKSLYDASKICVIPSHWTGGSQRTALEAMSMNLPVIAMSDSDKTSEFVNDSGFGMVVEPNPSEIRKAVKKLISQPVSDSIRSYVLNKWSEKHYADSLESGLEKICKV